MPIGIAVGAVKLFGVWAALCSVFSGAVGADVVVVFAGRRNVVAVFLAFHAAKRV